MNERYNNLVQLVHTLQQDINEMGPAQIQKIYSSRLHICFCLRFRGQTKYLLMGRGTVACGIEWSTRNINASERLRDRFLELLRNWLSGRRIHKVETFYQENGLIIHFNGEIKQAELFVLWAKSKLHFALRKDAHDLQPKESFVPWLNASIQRGDNAYGHQEIKKLYEDSFKQNEITFTNIESDIPQSATEKKQVTRKSKFLKRKIENIANDISRLSNLISLQEKVSALEEHEVQEDIYLYGEYKLKIKKGLNFYQKRDFIFQKIKSFRVAKVILEKRLVEAKKESFTFIDSPIVNQGRQFAVMPEWKSSKGSKKVLSGDDNVPFDQYQISDGTVIAHGKNATANDWLRSKWSRKEDYWFHLENKTSGHVFVRLSSRSFDQEFLSVIASLLASSESRMIGAEIDLIYTQVKNIKGIKGQPGAVTMKKTKQVRLVYRADWKEIIAKL